MCSITWVKMSLDYSHDGVAGSQVFHSDTLEVRLDIRLAEQLIKLGRNKKEKQAQLMKAVFFLLFIFLIKTTFLFHDEKVCHWEMVENCTGSGCTNWHLKAVQK